MGLDEVVAPPRLVVPPLEPPPVEVEVVVTAVSAPVPVRELDMVRLPLVPVRVTEPLVVVTGATTVVELLLSVALTVPVVRDVVAVRGVVDAVAAAHRAEPAAATLAMSAAGHAPSTQGAAMEAMGAAAVPHWQATSVTAQPAEETAALMHEVAQAGMPERFWARAPAAAVRMRVVFMLGGLGCA